jgi:hypothetical protein
MIFWYILLIYRALNSINIKIWRSDSALFGVRLWGGLWCIGYYSSMVIPYSVTIIKAVLHAKSPGKKYNFRTFVNKLEKPKTI